MNRNKILAGGLFVLLAVGCYKDKGNYDYKDVNNFEIVLSPESPNEDNTYTINQPAADSAHFTLKADIRQTLESGKDNLSFEWLSVMVIKEKQANPWTPPAEPTTIRDTVHAEEITLSFPPGKESTASVLCRVKDLTTDIEYYKNITVKTQVPFHDAWLLAHGAYGQRKVGAIEWDVDGNMRWTEDILASMGQQAFPYLTSITYSIEGSFEGYLPTERLLLTSAPDSSFAITPFDCKTMTNWMRMRPGSFRDITISGKIFNSDVSSHMGFTDNTGHFFWGRSMGFFYEAWGHEVPGFHVDRFYINREGYATLWDDVNKRFMYYRVPNYMNGYNEQNQERQYQANTSEIAYFESVSAAEMQDKEILYAGRGTKSVGDQEESTLFIARNRNTGKCYLYQFSYEGGQDDKAKGKDDDKDDGSSIGTVERDSLRTIRFNERTLFAASDQYNDQLFYAQDNQLFRLILSTQESINFYSVEGTIKQFAFRLSNLPQGADTDKARPNMQIIGLVVQKANGTDEFQEIYLDTAGDVTDVKTYPLDGVSSIVDFAYTYMNRTL